MRCMRLQRAQRGCFRPEEDLNAILLAGRAAPYGGPRREPDAVYQRAVDEAERYLKELGD